MNSGPITKTGTEKPIIVTTVPTLSNHEYCRYACMVPIGTAIITPKIEAEAEHPQRLGQTLVDGVHRRATA